jgi:ubiquinone/menaquinone biosynthesis C-methylase UbiE
MSGIDPEAYEAWFIRPIGKYADRAEKRLIDRFVRTEQGGRLLDAGCGTGHFTAVLAGRGANVIGLDNSFEMLEYAKSRYHIHNLVYGNAEALPFVADSFDTVVMFTVLEFLEEPRAALAEILRVLKPSGQFVIGFLNRRSPWGILRQVRGLLGNLYWRKARLYSRGGILNLLNQAGFTPIKSESVLSGSFVLTMGNKQPSMK